MRAGRMRADMPLNQQCVGLAFSEDGQTLLTSTWGTAGEATFWNVRDGARRRVLPMPQRTDDQVNGTLLSASGDLSFAASAPVDSVTMVNLTTGEARWNLANWNAGGMTMALSHDGRILAVSSGSSLGVTDSGILLLDADTGRQLGPPLEGHLAWVAALVFWPDGKTLASASADRTIRLWDVSDPAHPRQIGRPLRGHEHEVWRLALLPDGKTLVSGAKDGVVCLWDTSLPRTQESELVLGTVAWDFAKTGASLITADSTRVDRLEGLSFQERHPILELPRVARFCTLRDHGRFLGVWYPDGSGTIWDLVSMHTMRPHPRTKVYTGNGFWDVTPEQTLLLCFNDYHEAHEWDPFSNREVVSPWKPAGGDIQAYSTSADQRWRLTASSSGWGTLTDASNGRVRTFDVSTTEVFDACLSPDGKFAAFAAGQEGLVKIWKTEQLAADGSLAAPTKLGEFTLAPHSVCFSPDGRRLAAGDGASEAIKIWDMDSLQELLTLSAHGSLFNPIRFSPDGNVLASSNQEGELHLWRAPSWADIAAAEALNAEGYAPPPQP